MIHRIVRHAISHIYPTKHNSFVPHVLREWPIVAILVMGAGLFTLSQFAMVTGNFGLTAEVYPAVVVSLTNKDRAAQSLAPLSINPLLERAAKLKAEDMAHNSYFAHTSPAGITPWHWFGEVGYKFMYAGENLAVNFDESQTVQNAWLNSPTHRANIMSGNFTEMGVATAEGIYKGAQTTFVVEMFGMPATARVAAVSQPKPEVPISKPTPKSIAVVPTGSVISRTVAGETADTIHTVPVKVVEEQDTFVMVQNTDPTLEQAPTTPVQQTKVPWYKRALFNTNSIAGTILTIIAIILFFATVAMVAREYEKHHVKHMVYGSLMMVIFFSFLFVGKLGVFHDRPASFTASSIELQ